MNKYKLWQIIFMALCCDCGLVAKKIISPVANIVTESLHIPGGIATGFSLMFLTIAASVLRKPGCATLMSAVQSLLALAFGMTGSMGALAPVGYIIPGILIDLCVYITVKTGFSPKSGITASCILSSVGAALVADIIVFHLGGLVLAVYLSVAASTGAVTSVAAAVIYDRLSVINNKILNKENCLS